MASQTRIFHRSFLIFRRSDFNLTAFFSSSSPSSSSSSSSSLQLNSEIENESVVTETISSAEKQLAEKLHSAITKHHAKHPTHNPNPNPIPNPNPNPSPSPSALVSDFEHKIPELSFEFQRICGHTLPSPAVVTTVIELFRNLRHGIPFIQILAFFNWCINIDGFAHSPLPYTEMVDLSGRLRQFDLAWHLITTMKKNGVVITPHTFSVLIRRYVKSGMASEAVHTFNRMEEFCCRPDIVAFTVVLSVLCKKKRAAEAQEFFENLKHRFEPDVVIYTSLVHGWCRGGDISMAEKVFGEMKSIGIKPNVYTYSIVIDGLCRVGQISRAHDVFAEMIDVGCKPNSVTYNNLIRVHVKSRRREKVLQVFNQMKRLGCEPDTITYNFLIDSHCRDGCVEDAIKVLDLMVKRGCTMDISSFNPILKCVCGTGDVNSAHRMYARMRNAKCKPNAMSYNILMKMFAMKKMKDMVFKMKKEMDEDKVEPNVNTYNILIRMFCGMGHWNNAYKFFKEMIELKCLRPSIEAYEMVLKQLRDSGQLKKHEELVEMMVGRGFVTRPL